MGKGLCEDMPSEVHTKEYMELTSLVGESYQNRDDLIDNIRKISWAKGYATVIRRSKKEKYVIIGCDRGGTYRGNNVHIEERKRKIAS